MNIIDFHVHFFPEKIAEKALAKLSGFIGRTPFTDATVRDTAKKMRTGGISLSVGMPIATRPDQTLSINAYADSLNRTPGFRSFGTVHPADPQWRERMDEVLAYGMKGIKLHPDYQEFFVDDPTLLPLYRYAGEKGLLILLHAGVDPMCPQLVRNTPARMAAVLKECPDTDFICAHMGGILMADEVREHLIGKRVFLDTSIMAHMLPSETLLSMIRAHGADRILFGSDCPWENPRRTADTIRSLPLTEEEQHLIFHENAERLLALPEGYELPEKGDLHEY